MSNEQRALSETEHAELRSLVLAGAQSIHPAGSRTGRIVAGAIALVLVGGVAGAAITIALNPAATAPAAPSETTGSTSPAPPDEPGVLSRPAGPEDALPDALPDYGRASVMADSVRLAGEVGSVRFYVARAAEPPADYCVLIWPTERPEGWVMGCGGGDINVSATGTGEARLHVGYGLRTNPSGWVELDPSLSVYVNPSYRD